MPLQINFSPQGFRVNARVGFVKANSYATATQAVVLPAVNDETSVYGAFDNWRLVAREGASQSVVVTDLDPSNALGPLWMSESDPEIKIEGNVISWVQYPEIQSTLHTSYVTLGRGKSNRLRASISFTTSSDAMPVKACTSHAVGSLSEHVVQQCSLLIDGLLPSSQTTDVFSSYTNEAYTPGAQPCLPVVRNPDCYVPVSLLTGISVMTQYARNTADTGETPVIVIEEQTPRPGTLISPIHCIGAQHYHAQVGEVYVFLDENGVTQERTVVKRIWIGGLASYIAEVGTGFNETGGGLDCVVSVLDAPVTGCKIYKIMPENWIKDYAPDLRFGNRSIESGIKHRADLPHIRYARHPIQDAPAGPGKASMLITAVTGSYALQNGDMVQDPDTQVWVGFSNVRDFAPWGHQRRSTPVGSIDLYQDSHLEGGDSGCPQFIPIDLGDGLDLCYIGAGKEVWSITNAPRVLKYITEAMDELTDFVGDTNWYQPQVPDLSNFTFYGDAPADYTGIFYAEGNHDPETIILDEDTGAQ